MLAANHTIAGVLIGLSVQQPLVAVPIALASHFLLDVIPHHGNDIRFKRGQRRYNQKVALDGLVSIQIALTAVMLQPQAAGMILIAVFSSLLPDLLWPIALHIKQKGPLWGYFKFHKHIQHSETPRGIIMEALWFMLAGGFMAARLTVVR